MKQLIVTKKVLACQELLHSEFSNLVGAIKVTSWTAEVVAWEKYMEGAPNPFLMKHDHKCFRLRCD